MKDTDDMKDIDGELPSVSSEYDNEAFGDQIGIVQLASAKFDDQVKHVNAILKSIQKYACPIKDKDQKLKMARCNLEKFNPTQYDDCTVMIADYEELLKKCESWADGPFGLSYGSMQRLVSKCTQCVQTEYFDKISEDKVQELDVDFDGFKTQLTDACDIATRKQRLESGMDNRSQMCSLNPRMPFFGISNSRANNITRPTMPLKPDCDTNEFTDTTIKCNFPGCGTDFIWSSGEQQFSKDKGHEHAPKKCAEHKPQKTCGQFLSTGNCPFGIDCKSSHVKPEGHVHKINLPCRFYEAGACLAGDQCKFLHPDNPQVPVHIMGAVDNGADIEKPTYSSKLQGFSHEGHNTIVGKHSTGNTRFNHLRNLKLSP